MAVIRIGAIDDPRLDDYRDLRDRQLKGREGLPGLFLGEQPTIVEQMLRMPGVTKSALITPNWIDRIAPAAPPEVPVFVADEAAMMGVTGIHIHRGALAVGYRSAVERNGLDELLDHERFTALLCEDIANIDNIGLLFRNAAAFAADAVILSPRCHDPLYRKSLRVSIGHALRVPYVRSRDWRGDLRRLRARGVTLIAAATGGDAADVDAVPAPDRVGVVVGAEFTGVSSATLELCDYVARIRMAEGVDSLNVAVAAAVCLHRFSTGRRL